MATRNSNAGHSKDRPRILGSPNGAEPILVEATGTYDALRVGHQRWVTGTGVDRGLTHGVLVQIFMGDEAPVEATAVASDVQVIVEPAAQVVAEPETLFDPGDHSVAEVREYIADHPEDRARVLQLEAAGKARKSLVG